MAVHRVSSVQCTAWLWSGHNGVAAEALVWASPVTNFSPAASTCQCVYKGSVGKSLIQLHRRLGTWTASLLIWLPQLPQSAKPPGLFISFDTSSFIYSLAQRHYTRLSDITSCSLLLARTARLIKSHPLPTPHLINRNGSQSPSFPPDDNPLRTQPACRQLSLPEYLSVNQHQSRRIDLYGKPCRPLRERPSCSSLASPSLHCSRRRYQLQHPACVSAAAAVVLVSGPRSYDNSPTTYKGHLAETSHLPSTAFPPLAGGPTRPALALQKPFPSSAESKLRHQRTNHHHTRHQPKPSWLQTQTQTQTQTHTYTHSPSRQWHSTAAPPTLNPTPTTSTSVAWADIPPSLTRKPPPSTRSCPPLQSTHRPHTAVTALAIVYPRPSSQSGLLTSVLTLSAILVCRSMQTDLLVRTFAALGCPECAGRLREKNEYWDKTNKHLQKTKSLERPWLPCFMMTSRAWALPVSATD